jgi:hypothetical protein
MWICEIHEYDEQNVEQAELKLCPNPKTTMIKYFQVFSSIFLKAQKKRIIHVCLKKLRVCHYYELLYWFYWLIS